MRRVPGTLERDQRPARQLGERGAGGMEPDRVVAAVHDQHRAADPGRELAHRSLVKPGRGHGRDQRLRRCLQAPANAVLDLLGRMRFGEHLGEEELQELPVVRQPVVPVELLPALVFIQLLGERRDRPGPRRGLAEGHRGADEHQALHPFRVPRGEQQRPLRPRREADHERAIGRGRVQHAQRVRRELGLPVGRGLGGPVRAAVAAPVERDHPAVPRQVGDLHLPAARVNNRPGRQQQNRRIAGAVHLVVDPHPAALHEALGAGVARPGLLRARPRQRGCGRHGLASYTMLNGVSATRRNRVNPPAVTTSRILASPAWAPSARPTSCDSDDGVHSSVENA